NPHPIRACRAGVHPNVRVGIDHDCLAGLLASDHVARPRQIGVVESSEKHRSPTALVAALLAGRTIVSVLLMHRDQPGNIHHVNSKPSRTSTDMTPETRERDAHAGRCTVKSWFASVSRSCCRQSAKTASALSSGRECFSWARVDLAR